MRTLDLAVDKFISAIALVIGFGALSNVLHAGAEESDSQAIQAIWLAVVLTAGYRLVTRSPGTKVYRLLSWPVVLLIVWATASSFWSLDPLLSLRRSLALAGTALVGLYMARSLRPQTIASLARDAAALVSMLSLAAVAVGVSWARAEDGSVIGLLTHRNSLGAVSSIGLVMSFAAPAARPRLAATRVVLIAALIASNSRTSLLALLVAASVTVLFVVFQSNRRLGVGLAAFTVALGTVGFVGAGGTDAVLGGLGRDSTLTGRTELWRLLLDAGNNSRSTGLGFGTQWTSSSPAASAINSLFPGIASAHNIYLEVWLSLGVIGTLLLCTSLLVWLLRTATPVLSSSVGQAWFALAVFVVARGFTESGFPAQNTSATMLFFASMALTSVDTVAKDRGASNSRSARGGLPPAAEAARR